MFLWTWKHFHHVFFLFVKVSLKKSLVSSWEFQRCTCFCRAVRRHNLPGPPCTVSKRTQWNMFQHEDIRVWEQLIGWVVISLFSLLESLMWFTSWGGKGSILTGTSLKCRCAHLDGKRVVFNPGNWERSCHWGWKKEAKNQNEMHK